MGAFDDFMEFYELVSAMTEDERKLFLESLDDVSFEVNNNNLSGTHDVLFIGSDGKRVVKGLHFPREGLGSDGPVLFPETSEFILVAAYSDEFIQLKANDINEKYWSEDDKNAAWSDLMQELAMEIAYAADNASDVETLDDLLGET